MRLSLLIKASLISSILITSLHAATCDEPDAAKAAGDAFKVDAQNLMASQHVLEEEIKQEIESKKKSSHWTQERISEVMLNIMKSPSFNEFEQRKKPLMQRIIDITKESKKDDDAKKSCLAMSEFVDILTKVKTINQEQYKFMLDQVKTAN